MNHDAAGPGSISGPSESYDAELLDRAKKRVKRREQFRQHLASYVIVNGMLVGIWLVTGRGYFWPIWPLLGWGVGLAFDAMSLRDTGPTREQIEAEAQRLRLRDERRAGLEGPPAAGPMPGAPPASSPWDAPTGGPQDGR